MTFIDYIYEKFLPLSKCPLFISQLIATGDCGQLPTIGAVASCPAPRLPPALA